MANASEEMYDFTTSGMVANTSPGFPSFRRPQTVSLASIIVAMFTGTIGTCANAVVLVVLIFARRHFGSHVNTISSSSSSSGNKPLVERIAAVTTTDGVVQRSCSTVRSHVNTLITNQSAIDLKAWVLLVD